MASRLIAAKSKSVLMQRNGKIIAYLPNLRAAVRHFRAFSSYDENKPPKDFIETVLVRDEVYSESLDAQLGLLSPDKKFTLPGQVGVGENLNKKRYPELPTTRAPQPDIFTAQLPHERQAATIQEFLLAQKEFELQEEEENLMMEADKLGNTLECSALDCNKKLKNEFQELFPTRDLSGEPLTVITLSQKTQHDMTVWSQEIEDEREMCLEQFMTSAKDICTALQTGGYWADFIDPSSGRPFFGEYTNSTLFEKDERMRHLGFTIEDLGCCKVLSHAVWGTYTYAGVLFTNAPLDNSVVSDIVKTK